MNYFKGIFFIKAAIALFCFCFAAASAAIQVDSPEIKIRYLGPGSLVGEDKRNDYYIELLQKALARTGKQYTFEQAARGLSGSRQLYTVADGSVDVGWSVSTDEKEKTLRAIRIPIDKGLIGWRLLLINKDDAKLFADVKSINDLRNIRLGQGQDWADTFILRANQFNVEGVSTYDGMFKMLKQKRFRYFPRSIMEIWSEVDEHKDLNLAIESTILIHYPAAFYYFVRTENISLAQDIETGLEAMIKDGEFDKVFNKYHAQRIKNAKLGQRRVYKLNNPYLPKATPLDRPELWFNIDKIK
ncbi:MAG: transporter substrate-binding domain-containing protein [Pseudomonadota bacterium]